MASSSSAVSSSRAFPSARGLLLLVHMPWFTPNAQAPDAQSQRGYHGHVRVSALLHTLEYRCALQQLGVRMVVMVQPSELGGCEPLCADWCSCVEAAHHREYMQRNIAAHASGEEDLLFAHADCWINLGRFIQMLEAGGANYTMIPARGLHGTSYLPVQSKCFTVIHEPHVARPANSSVCFVCEPP